ncbi:MAG: lipopolysaccharide biosynthesis protein [Anaerolineales bacterium]|jgi:O-antigen/teichoic acid export membrane protein
MKTRSFSRAGNAIFWRAIQYGGEKVIFLLRLIILAKLLTPNDFGLLAIAGVAIDFLMRISDFGMIPALIQREDASEQHYDAAWTIGVLRALAITIIVLLTANVVADFFAEPRAAGILRAVSLRPLIEASASIMVTRFARKLDFRSLAFMQLPKALTNTIVSIILARWFGVWALVAGVLAGSSMYLVLSYILAPHWPRVTIRFGAIRSLARFGRWVFWTSIIVMVGQSVLRLVIGRQLGAEELGLYYLAASLAFLPADIASQVVGQVAFPFYSRLQTDIRQALVTFQDILISLFMLILPLLFLLIVLAPTLVGSVLGPRWEGAAPIIQVLALAAVIGLLGETITPILKGTGRPNNILVIETIQSLLLISLVWALAGRYGVVGAAFAWVPAVATSQFLGVLYLRKIFHQPFTGLVLPIVSITVVSTLTAIIALTLNNFLPGLFGFLLTSVFSLFFAGSFLWVLERRFSLGLTAGLARAYPQIAGLLGLGRVGILPKNGGAP